MKKTGLLLLCLWISLYACSQNLSNIWHFGTYAGLDFSSGNPKPFKNEQSFTIEGCASICDKERRLLFYTNGIYVTNRQHTRMPNGIDLFGHYSSTQSDIIVPAINDPLRFYIFTTDAEVGSNGLCYSIVNMNLDNGLGDVEKKNVPLLQPTCEKLTAIKHCYGKDTWIITHRFNSDAFYA